MPWRDRRDTDLKLKQFLFRKPRQDGGAVRPDRYRQPDSASTVWHAFGALVNGVQAGYAADGLSLILVSIQGGTQFRAADMPVKEPAAPGKLNNFAIDASYEFGLAAGSLLPGGSYRRGSAYCQDYPVQHFEPCRDNNPAFRMFTDAS